MHIGIQQSVKIELAAVKGGACQEHRAVLALYLAILSEVNTLILLEVISQKVNNALVKVISSKVGVATCAQHLKDAIPHLDAATQGGQEKLE